MSFIQRFFTRIFPAAWVESMRAESRAWRLTCEQCGQSRSVWEMGGIRWKAKGTRRVYNACAACGQRTWHTLTYHPDA